jgi:hypothetical protein
LEPVPNAGDKAGGLDGGAGLNSERQNLSAGGLVEQRKIFHNLERGVLFVHGGKCPVTFGLEQVCEDGAQLGNGGLGFGNTIASIRMSGCRQVAPRLHFNGWNFGKIRLLFPQESDGLIIRNTLSAAHERFDRRKNIFFRREQVVLKIIKMIEQVRIILFLQRIQFPNNGAKRFEKSVAASLVEQQSEIASLSSQGIGGDLANRAGFRPAIGAVEEVVMKFH